ncbi:MAG: hypothetical protein PHS92_05115 [Candidatus Gracilibacteria bacterium]|nr:hypothetical protein [Candidatus Gracilibacteria bacterium]
MIDLIKEEYLKYLVNEMDYQKIVGNIDFGGFHLIKNQYSYKTGIGEFDLNNKEIKLSPEIFYKKFTNGEFFDVKYSDNIFTAYSIKDYLILLNTK